MQKSQPEPAALPDSRRRSHVDGGSAGCHTSATGRQPAEAEVPSSWPPGRRWSSQLSAPRTSALTRSLAPGLLALGPTRARFPRVAGLDPGASRASRVSKAGARRLPAWVALVQGRRQYAIDGSHAPTGSLYRPIVISVDCWTSFSPLARHQRRRSAFRDGTRIPRPMNVCADASSAIRCWLVSATACQP